MTSEAVDVADRWRRGGSADCPNEDKGSDGSKECEVPGKYPLLGDTSRILHAHSKSRERLGAKLASSSVEIESPLRPL